MRWAREKFWIGSAMILLTRKTRVLAEQLRSAGHKVFECPLIERVALTLTAPQQALQHQHYDHVFVGSQFAGESWPLHNHVQATFWAPGQATAAWLARQFNKVNAPTHGEGVDALNPDRNGRWLILTALGGRSERLAERVRQADVVPVYQTSIDISQKYACAAQLPTTVVLTSKLAATALIDLPHARQSRYIVSSNEVANYLRQHGISNVFTVGQATESALLPAILQVCKDHHD